MARGTVVIDTNRCKGCELCTTVCPQHVLVMADFYNARGYRLPATPKVGRAPAAMALAA